MVLDDIWSLKSIQRVQISPDGTRILFSVTQAGAGENAGADALKMLDVTSGRVDEVELGETRHHDRHGSDIVWTAGGDGLLFLQTEDGKASWWQWDLASKTSRRLFVHDAASTSVPEYEESPDGQRIAFVSVSQGVNADAGKRQRALTAGGLVLGDENGRRYAPSIPVEVWVWDRATQQKQRVYAGRRVSRMEWSPDGSLLAVQSMVGRKVTLQSLFSPGGESAVGITIIDVASGRQQKLRDVDLQSEVVLGWSPDGRSLAVDSQTIVEAASSEAGALGMSHGRQVKAWTRDAEPGTRTLRETSGALIKESRRPPRVLALNNGGWFHWHRNGTIYYGETAANRTTVISGAKPNGEGAPISDRKWHLSLVSFAREADVAAAVRESVNEPPELALIDLRTGEMKTLTTLNAHFANLRRQRVESYRVTNRFGYETHNWLIKPPDYQPDRKYPLVILLYGFNNAFAVQPWMKNFAPFEYARMGAVVLFANYPVYDGRPGDAGPSVPDKWRFAMAGNPLASLEAAVESLGRDGLIDPRKVALCGFSYGGFLTQYAVTHSSKFSVAFVNDGGAWNPSVYLNSGMRDSAYLLGYDYLFGGSPFGRGGQAMRDFLPAYGFGRLAVPVLFEGHGGEEGLPAYADFYLTGRQEGTPIEAVIYKDDHILTGRERQFSSISRSTDWLRYWLLDAENPHPVDEDQYTRWAKLRERLKALKSGSGSESLSRRGVR